MALMSKTKKYAINLLLKNLKGIILVNKKERKAEEWEKWRELQ